MYNPFPQFDLHITFFLNLIYESLLSFSIKENQTAKSNHPS